MIHLNGVDENTRVTINGHQAKTYYSSNIVPEYTSLLDCLKGGSNIANVYIVDHTGAIRGMRYIFMMSYKQDRYCHTIARSVFLSIWEVK